MIAKYSPRSIAILTKWADHDDAKISDRQVIIADVGDIGVLSGRQYDVVTTFSVLEHISDIRQAFANVADSLRPDGLFLSIFGPIWSGPYRHHLYVDVRDPRSNFCLWDMPAFLHLLCSPTELYHYYRGTGYVHEQARLMLENIYDKPMINRMFYEDYVDALSDRFWLAASRMFYNRLPRDLYNVLRSKFPRYQDFSTYGGIWIAHRNDL
jgi:SAM-dependent methyltransferase